MLLGIVGGLWFGSLVTGALLGILPAAILFLLGAAVCCIQLVQERQAEKRAASWRKNYPSYKY